MKLKIYRKFTLVLLFIVMGQIRLLGQEGIVKRFKQMHKAEKYYILFHPAAALKAYPLTVLAQNKTQEMLKDKDLDTDENGGQVDAFRHSFWMALLTQEIGAKKARKLGKAHEKAAYEDYLRLQNEDGVIPDFKASFMDLKNNEEGIHIGEQNPEASPEALTQIIKKEILDGKLWKLKKDANGNYYDHFEKLIPFSEWHGKWVNDKALVPSDFKLNSINN